VTSSAAPVLAVQRAVSDQLRAAMDAALEGHAVYAPVLDEQGRLVDLLNAYLNPAGARLRGITASSWLGGSLLDDGAREGGAAVAERYLAVARTGVPWTGHPCITTTRGIRSHAVSVVPTGPPPSGVLVSSRDIEDETAAAERLAATARLLSDTQAVGRIGSWEWHPRTDALEWSAGMLALYGLEGTTHQPTAADSLARVHPEDRAAYLAHVSQVLRTGGRTTLEHRITTPDGRTRHIFGWAQVERDAAGRPVRVQGGAQDITERVCREQALARSEQQFRLTLQHSPIGLALLGLDGRWLQVNPALADLLGRSSEEMLGLDYQALTHPDDVAVARAGLAALLTGSRDSHHQDQPLRHADGHDVWVGLHVALVRDTDGEPAHLVAQIVDIADRRATTDDLAKQARTDPLTGLANRRAWEEGLRDAIDHAAAHPGDLVVAILDLDHFKVYNDTCGHPAGDRLLSDTAAAWSAHLARTEPGCLLARIGGEEFALLLVGSGVLAARALLTELCALVPQGQTASAGITRCDPTDEPRTLMARADAALYTAKRLGRSRIEALDRG